ncbi:MAG TPA: hypothetical protein VL402_06595 [Xanthobacteraceae bacterium]|jgi:hypothetical protein|nr:hypothetical protein [Xanthobacteraceae bacterium]
MSLQITDELTQHGAAVSGQSQASLPQVLLRDDKPGVEEARDATDLLWSTIRARGMT